MYNMIRSLSRVECREKFTILVNATRNFEPTNYDPSFGAGRPEIFVSISHPITKVQLRNTSNTMVLTTVDLKSEN